MPYDPEKKKACQRRYREKHGHEFLKERERRRRLLRRVIALFRLGCVCAQCGFCDPRALQIDHINGGGCKEQKLLRTEGIIEKIIKMAHPEKEYQVLCANCNWIKRWERGETH